MDDQGKRLMLAFAISFAVILVYQKFFAPPPTPPPVQETQQAEEAAGPGDQEIIQVAPADLPAISGSVQGIVAAAERSLKVETPLYTAKITNRGAALTSFTLKNFRLEQKDAGSRVEMVRTYSAEEEKPLAAEFAGAGGPLGFAGALYRTDGSDLQLEGGEERSLTFTYRTEGGLQLTRTLTFDGDDYRVVCRNELVNLSDKPVSGRLFQNWAAGLEPPSGDKKGLSINPSSRYGYQGAVILEGDKLRKIKGKKLAGTEIYEKAPAWIATEDMYFAAVVLPGETADGAVARKSPDGRVQVGIFDQMELPAGTGARQEASVYIGPKEMDTLAAVDKTLTRIIDLGMFGFIAKPLLMGLNFCYRYVGNYGLAIIILSALIKLVFIPFSTLSHRSMKKMSAIQPQINALRERYKKDKDKLNAEIMKLYSENKVNPAGGCLPIMVQIPVFFALYRALLGAIELRHAPFYLWIADLSAKDPLYITPIFMGATMFLQQKMTPTPTDSRQAKVMMFMPIVFTAMFLSFPSGLVIYWTVNNLLTIAHQYWMNRGELAPVATEEPPKKGKQRPKGI